MIRTDNLGKLYALRRELSWTHWRLIMRVENPQVREYYIEETAQQHWTSRVLERAIETRSFERLLRAPEPATVAELERRHILDWPQQGEEDQP